MPKHGQILSTGIDPKGNLCVWVLVDPLAPLVLRAFLCVGTGNLIIGHSFYDRKFIGTVVMTPFVWHVFELVENDER